MTTRIKICGITSIQDAELALAAGADFIGLILVPDTPRYITPSAARAIVEAVNGTVPCVAVFRDNPLEEVLHVLSTVKSDFVQLHGQESLAFCQALPLPIIKTFTVEDSFQPEVIQPYAELIGSGIEYLLLERSRDYQNAPWQTGAFQGMQQDALPLPCFLAGGLQPENVGNAIAALNPFGVDVASGIEQAPGVKDPDKLRAFCQAVKIQKTH